MDSSDKRRVAVICMLIEPGGVQSCALALIRGLNARGIVPDVLWDQQPSRSLLKEASAKAGFRRLPFRVPHRVIVRLPNTLRYLAWVPNVLDGETYRARYDCFFSFYNGFLVPKDIPHVYYLSGPPLLPQLQLTPRGVRGWPLRCSRSAYKSILRRKWPAYEYHRGCNYVINSNYTAGLFRETHGVSLPVVYPPLELSNRTFAPDDLTRRDSLLFFSRIVDYKRPEMVLALAQRHPQLRCVIMGGVSPNRRSYFDSLRSRYQLNGNQVVFYANPSADIIRAELGRARFYVFPAINEHFGMTTPEAIASGAVPFVHDSGGQKEIVPDPALRFMDREFFPKFNTLLASSIADLNSFRDRLNRHMRTFSEELFTSRLAQQGGIQ